MPAPPDIAIVIPAYRAAVSIGAVLRAIPPEVRWIVVVDDGGTDDLATAVRAVGDPRIDLVTHEVNRGVGAAVLSGYRRAVELGAEIVVKLDADGQMDPADLDALVAPLAAGEADYAKGNRFLWPGGWRQMPFARLVGNVVLSLLTRIASGYHHLFDSQCGYTAASRVALAAILAGPLFPRYGYPNDLLARLAAAEVRVLDVPVRPVYGVDWRSGIRVPKVVGPLLGLLGRAFAQRVVRAFGRQRPEPVPPLPPA